MKSKLIILLALLVSSVAVTAQIDRSKMPKQGPTPSIKLTKPYTFKLDNGLTVLVVENNKLPRISVSISVDNIPHAEGNKAGVASLVSSMLGNGTTSISKDDFNEEIDYLGASIGLSGESAFAGGLSKYADRIVELMADAALNPLFTQKDLDDEKKKLIQNLKSSESSAAAVAGRVRGVLAYGKNHPFGEYTTEETVNSITLDDVKNYHSSYFVPSNAYMVVSGNITTEDAQALISKHFDGWLAAKAPVVSMPKVADAQYRQINFIDMPNAVQSELAVMNVVDIKMADEDHHAALIANYILGGAFGSYLNMNLREKHGFTYGAGSSIGRNAKNTTSTFRATTKVRNAVTDSAVVEMLKEIKRIKTEPVSDKDLANAKAKYLGNFIMASENPNTQASYAINIKTENLPADFYETFIAKINAVTKEDVMRVANKYFNLDNARIVVVGKGKDVLEKLEKISFDGKKVPVLYFDKYGTKTEKPNYDVELPAGTTAQTILEKYIEKVGGKTKLEAVKTVAIKAQGSIQGMTLDLEMKNTTKKQSSVNVSMNGNTLSKQSFNGESGYLEAQGQKMDMPAEMSNNLKEEAVPFPELYYLTKSGVTFNGIEEVDGKKSYVIQVSDNSTIYYDVETGLKTKQVTKSAMGEQALIYADYKEVSGILFPHIFKQSMGPQSVEFKVQEVKVNEGVSDADFN